MYVGDDPLLPSKGVPIDSLFTQPMRGAVLTGRFRVMLIAAALTALVLVVACDTGGGPPAVTRVVQWPDNWPVPPLPVMSLQHEDGSIQGDPHAYCWQFEGAADRVCEAEHPWSGLYRYAEIASHQRIPIMIEPETRPTKLFAQVYTKPGNIMVGGLRRLSAVNPKLDVDLSPGEYNVRLIGYWQDNNVSYEFGLIVPGLAALIAECSMTLIGVDPVLSLKSHDDPRRTAPDDANGMGCRFSKPIARVTMTLHNDALGSYTETFHIDPPSTAIGFPLRDNVASMKTGGPLPAGKYSRRMVAITEEGEEWNFGPGLLEEVEIAGP